MLNTLETYLTDALRLALPQHVTLITGPALQPAASQVPLVNVAATALYPLHPASDTEDRKREPAFFTQRLALSGNGQRQDFPLPTDGKGELVEVELASGRLARHGDDYWLDNNTVRFYQAPVGEFTVLLKGARAGGYQELSPCRATLEIHAWADEIALADGFLAPSLAAVLGVFADLDRLELVRLEATGLILRLLKPMATVRALERVAVTGDKPLYCSMARCNLQGEWELTLTLGTPPGQGLIKTIESDLQIKV
ncbi:MAG: hypothetical protein DM484_24010 [Candidatus Methylumidiphilus alinenensis]|uniref:Uncharacterized protein n=1 Tax=Candidatus Methylumidiphilus alinenensis TaxID=2202197 RepID=A0A2W4SGW1_9GAMM|nr:MAG: hypothetical protein DM484_24010 [Candidatus Methylumidiphilus alinenensis]